jgi:hypothetical protein
LASILPTDWKSAQASGAAARQIETLATFERGLPEDIVVFHGVHWSRAGHGLETIGDIDFVVMSPAGQIVLIEQKAGFLNESADGLVKRYRGSSRRIKVEVDRTLNALSQRLATIRHGESLSIQYLLYCPDYTVRDRASAGLSAEQIVDSTQRYQLCEAIQNLLDDSQVTKPDWVRRLNRFFSNELELVPDASALVGRAQSLVTRMSEGLATWARRFEVDPPRLRIVATAGSGKTQLALALLHDASAQGQRALYVCFNRPLADHIRAAAPEDIQVFNYHQWCQHRLREADQPVDFSGANAFEKIEAASLALEVTEQEYVDMLIIDEGQDFTPAWRDDLLRLASRPSPAAQVWWMEDPMQELYGREPAAPQWPCLHAQVNYRSPRAVVSWINQVLQVEPPVIGSGPVQGSAPEVLAYSDDTGLIAQTKSAVTSALRAGFRRHDIAITTFSGRARSVIHPLESLGPNQLRKFSGRYDLFGNPEINDGDILLDTVFRFKGQSAPCVILTEVDFATLDETARRKLFVGVTRASLHVIVVCSEQVARMIE